MRYIQLSALLAISCVFVGCTPSSSSSVAKAEPRRAEAEVRTAGPVIEVSTAEEFVKAIGPDRTIRLTPGKIILSDVSDRQMKYVRWDQNFDGKTLTIRHVKNLKIVGPQKQRAELLVRPRYAFVLNFEDCHDVTLRHVVLGHAPE